VRLLVPLRGDDAETESHCAEDGEEQEVAAERFADPDWPHLSRLNRHQEVLRRS
jgi:hypothetical protein